MPNKLFAVRLKPEIAEAIENAAKRDHRTAQDLLRKIIIEWLERNSRDDQE